MIDLLLKLPKYPFDYIYLLDKVKEYSRPRDKISYMVKKGEIIRIKKGLYIVSPKFGGSINYPILANLLYGPSYISLDYSLSYYGLIPERVAEITSITNKRNKNFITPVGNFSYKYLNSNAFSIGVTLNKSGKTSFFIASKEKALCDKIALIKNIESDSDVHTYLEEDLRIDLDELEKLDIDILSLIKEQYHNKSVSNFVDWYKTFLKQV